MKCKAYSSDGDECFHAHEEIYLGLLDNNNQKKI